MHSSKQGIKTGLNMANLNQPISSESEKAAAVKKSAVDALSCIGPHLGQVDLWQDGSYNRVSLLRTEDIEVVAIYWKEGQRTPVHCHGESKCFFSILEGSLQELRYADEQGVTKTADLTLTAKDGIQSEVGIHTIGCQSGKAISLHFYSPPIAQD